MGYKKAEIDVALYTDGGTLRFSITTGAPKGDLGEYLAKAITKEYEALTMGNDKAQLQALGKQVELHKSEKEHLSKRLDELLKKAEEQKAKIEELLVKVPKSKAKPKRTTRARAEQEKLADYLNKTAKE